MRRGERRAGLQILARKGGEEGAETGVSVDFGAVWEKAASGSAAVVTGGCPAAVAEFL